MDPGDLHRPPHPQSPAHHSTQYGPPGSWTTLDIGLVRTNGQAVPGGCLTVQVGAWAHGVWVHGHMGAWVHGHMSAWVHMGVWAHGRMGA